MRLLFLLLLTFLLISHNSGAEDAWTLQDLIKYATENSPYLLEAKKDVEIANLDEDIAWQNHIFGFSLNLEALSGVSAGQKRLVSGGGVVISNNIGGTNIIVPFFSLHLDYPLLEEGKFIFQRSIREDIAKVNYNETEESYLMRKADVISSVSDLFLQIALKKKEIEYLNQNEARLETIVEQSKKRFENKLITQSDLLEAELQLTDTQTNIKIAEMDLDVLKKRLASLSGMPLDQNPPDVDGDVSVFESINSLIPNLDELRSLAFERNPRLSVANLGVQKSQLNLKLTQNRIYPTLSLTSTAAVNTSLDNSEFAGLSLRFPLDELFKRFLTKDPELLKMQVAVEKSRITLQFVRSSVEVEIIEDYTNWSKAKELAASAWNKVKVKETRVNEGQMRSKEGLVTTGEYLGYINSYQEAYNEFEQKKREEYNALLVLLKNASLIDRFLVESNPPSIPKEKVPEEKNSPPAEGVEKKSDLEKGRTKEKQVTLLPTDEPTKLESRKKETTKKSRASMPPIGSERRYAVQIGAFKKEEEAEKIVEILKSKGYPAFIKTYQIPGKEARYKVRVGSFKTKEEAEVCSYNLKTNEPGIKSALVVAVSN